MLDNFLVTSGCLACIRVPVYKMCVLPIQGDMETNIDSASNMLPLASTSDDSRPSLAQFIVSLLHVIYSIMLSTRLMSPKHVSSL